MIIPHLARKAIRASNRQITLETASQQGTDATIEATHCIIDGLADALIELDGRRAAFAFTANLSDRMARGLRGPTFVPDRLKLFDAAAPTPPPIPVPPRRWARTVDLRLAVWGASGAFWVGMAIEALLLR